MAPTPPSGDSPGSASGRQHEDRIRRNVACISCRDSKVRCRANPTPGKPCQRCDKLGMACVYDKSHKRITRRSKLELLEQELRTIKQVVNPHPLGETAWSPPTPRPNNAVFPQQNTPGQAAPPFAPPAIPMSLHKIKIPELAPRIPPAVFEKTGPTKSRMLGTRTVSGEDIDYYFDKFLTYYHPFVPVLRKKDPDECYQANKVLFWTIIYVALRRHARDDDWLFPFLVDQLGRDIYTLPATPNVDMESIHAILFFCAWPLPTVRFVTDPSATLISIAMTSAMQLGLHHGRGCHPEFCVGGRANIFSTDLEAATTWIACCCLAQRIATYTGISSPFLQHADTNCKKIVEDTLPPEFMTFFELQKFANKMHTAMEAQVMTHGGIFESTAQSWEDEFNSIRSVVTRVDSDCSRFFLLSTQLEVQSYFYLTPPTATDPLPLHVLKTYTTARALIATAYALETSTKFLTHAPLWAYRSCVDAACIAVSALHSMQAPVTLSAEESQVLAHQIHTIMLSCSVREGDLASRGAAIMDTFWSVRNLLPKFGGSRRVWPGRLGAAVTFWCLQQFRESLNRAKKKNVRVERGLAAYERQAALGAPNRTEKEQEEPLPEEPPPEEPMASTQDPFQDVDWSALMDDFGWLDEGPVFLGPPQC